MVKTYISSMELSIKCASGRRYLFDAVSGGGSMFRTSNLDVQADIEGHPMFKNGTCHWDAATKRAVERQEAGIPEEPAPALAQQTAEEAPSAPEAKVITVSGVADAKDYLAENFGVLRTQMRSKENIRKYAEMYNVTFVGL